MQNNHFCQPLLPASIAIILDEREESILLTKRLDVPIWVLPGGGIEPGETPEEAVIREVEEETGLIVTIVRKTAEYLPNNHLAAFTHVFICQILSGCIKNTNETAEAKFFPKEHLPLAIFPPHVLWIQESLANSKLIKRKLTEISYLNVLKYFLSHPRHVLSYLTTRKRKR